MNTELGSHLEVCASLLRQGIRCLWKQVRERAAVFQNCVSNIPGAVPRTSTYALSNATLPYVLKLANMGPEVAIKADPSLAKGVNIYKEKITYQAVAEAFGMEVEKLD